MWPNYAVRERNTILLTLVGRIEQAYDSGMGAQPVSLATQVAVVRAGRIAVARIPEVLVQCPGAELGALVGVLDDLASAAAAVRDAVMVGAVRRGEVTGALPTWIREQAPSLRQGDAQAVARVVTEATKGGPVWSGARGVEVDPQSPIGLVTAAMTHAPRPPDEGQLVTDTDPDRGADADADGEGVIPSDIDTASDSRTAPHSNIASDSDIAVDADESGAAVITTSQAPISPRVAVAVLGEIRTLSPRLTPAAVPTVTRVLIDLGREWGPGQVRRLRGALLAQYGLPGELDEVQEGLASAASLSSPVVECTGLTSYRLSMTPAQSAVLEAVIGPLSAPAPNRETGQRDLRPAGQRRVEALTRVCERAAAAVASGTGSDGAAGTFAALHVMCSLEDLQAATGLAPAARYPWTTQSATTPSATPATSDKRPADQAEAPTGTGDAAPSWVPGAGEVLGSRAQGLVLSPEQVRRLACHADLVPHVLGTRGEVLDVGRVVRLFTPGQRRHLLVRDRHCTYPGCDRPAAWARAHHLWHWADGGPRTLTTEPSSARPTTLWSTSSVYGPWSRTSLTLTADVSSGT